MSETAKQEGQKTVVSFISGLLIGGLLVWAFSGTAEKKENAAMTSGTSTVALTTSTSSSDTTSTTKPAPVTNTTTATTPAKSTTATTPTMKIGVGKVEVSDQPAGSSVKLTSATYPTTDGWIAVRDYINGQLGNILGAVRYSKEQGLIPESVILQRNTEAGHTYAVVFFSDDGNHKFNLDGDKQIDTGSLATFTAK